MQPQQRCFCAILAMGFALSGDCVFALPHWKPRPSGPTTVYAPRMRHFIVVSPTPAVAAPVTIEAGPASAGASKVFAGNEAVLAPPVHHGQTSLHGRVKKALSPAPRVDQALWQQQVESVPAYPWGWFGARRHAENTGHRRYLGGEYDWALGRGD